MLEMQWACNQISTFERSGHRCWVFCQSASYERGRTLGTYTAKNTLFSKSNVFRDCAVIFPGVSHACCLVLKVWEKVRVVNRGAGLDTNEIAVM